MSLLEGDMLTRCKDAVNMELHVLVKIRRADLFFVLKKDYSALHKMSPLKKREGTRRLSQQTGWLSDRLSV